MLPHAGGQWNGEETSPQVTSQRCQWDGAEVSLQALSQLQRHGEPNRAANLSTRKSILPALQNVPTNRAADLSTPKPMVPALQKVLVEVAHQLEEKMMTPRTTYR